MMLSERSHHLGGFWGNAIGEKTRADSLTYLANGKTFPFNMSILSALSLSSSHQMIQQLTDFEITMNIKLKILLRRSHNYTCNPCRFQL
jgi:hypothetical protein